MAFTEPPGGVMGKTLPSSMTQASKREGPSAANISSIAEAKSARPITRLDGMPYASAIFI